MGAATKTRKSVTLSPTHFDRDFGMKEQTSYNMRDNAYRKVYEATLLGL